MFISLKIEVNLNIESYARSTLMNFKRAVRVLDMNESRHLFPV